MPVTINCTVTTSIHSKHHKLLWVKNHNNFVQSDDRHTITSSKFDNSTQHHFLTIHKAFSTAAYTCMLVNTNGNVADKRTQYVFVNEGELPYSS